MTQRASRLSRRSFLLAATAGSAATAAAIVATKSTAPKSATTPGDKRATRGYQASEHTDNYYRTTKV
jgi:hypothetical protein